jgi:hypothetical protein
MIQKGVTMDNTNPYELLQKPFQPFHSISKPYQNQII